MNKDRTLQPIKMPLESRSQDDGGGWGRARPSPMWPLQDPQAGTQALAPDLLSPYTYRTLPSLGLRFPICAMGDVVLVLVTLTHPEARTVKILNSGQRGLGSLLCSLLALRSGQVAHHPGNQFSMGDLGLLSPSPRTV